MKKNKYKFIKESSNKSRIILVILIILMCIILVGIIFNEVAKIKSYNSENIRVDTSLNNSAYTQNERKHLLDLVNDENELDNNFFLNLTQYNDNIRIDCYAKSDAQDMINDANLSGYNIEISSAYVDADTQQNEYDQQVYQYMQEGYNEIKAETKTNKSISKAGYSDRETGLSIIISDTDSENTIDDNASKWLEENCANYGFIERYPKDKEIYTSKDFNKQYFRYVGKQDALEMRALNMCLEQYISYLDLQ